MVITKELSVHLTLVFIPPLKPQLKYHNVKITVILWNVISVSIAPLWSVVISISNLITLTASVTCGQHQKAFNAIL